VPLGAGGACAPRTPSGVEHHLMALTAVLTFSWTEVGSGA
jgi:hypothetical protein